MGGTARQFNKMYIDYKKRFKKPLLTVAELMPLDFSDKEFVEAFKRLYPHMWEDLEKQYDFWHEKNEYLIKLGKKSRYNFRKPQNFIMDCSYHLRIKLRKNKDRKILSDEERDRIESEIFSSSQRKLKKKYEKIYRNLYYVQEIEPEYAQYFINQYYHTHNLHERLEIIRELSKYKSNRIVQFFYKVNAGTRNFSLKKESMRYIQGLGLPFVLRRKKKGKKNYIDNEIVQNESSPEILRKRLYVDRLEREKVFDMFISHNSKDQSKIVDFFKTLNSKGYVAYIDWVNDKFDLKREWCNATTAEIVKERIKQSRVFVLYFSQQTLASQWCPWELGYADALGKKICVFQESDDIPYIPEFYSAYPKLKLDSEAIIKVNGQDVLFDQWIQQ